jgi:hypothetical protein
MVNAMDPQWSLKGKSQNSGPFGVENFLFSVLSAPALGPMKSPIDWVPETFPKGKAPGPGS